VSVYFKHTGVLYNNDHSDSIGLVGIVDVVDSAFCAAASGLDDLGATGGEVDIACGIDSRVSLAASNCSAMSVS
jgi:hypothetical protein